MSGKHTPGPWTCNPTSHHAHDYRLEVPGGQMPFTRGEGTEYANARLMAAAPDLLEALQEINGRLLRCAATGASASEAYDSFYQDIVNSAIQKATKA